MDGLNLEEELDHTIHSQQGDQGQVDKVQTGEDPEAHQLTQTAGRHQMKSTRHWSPRPNRRHNLPANHPSVRQCQLNKVKYRNSSSMERPPKRTLKEMSPAGSLSDPVIVASSEEETDSADGIPAGQSVSPSLHVTMRWDPSP